VATEEPVLPVERSASSVRSLERAFELLEHLADAGGQLALTELAEVSGLPMPTIYRLMRTLVNRGYVRQEPSKRYALGPRLIRLGETSERLLGSWARPALAQLVDEVGETANMALLEGDEAVYVAQVPSRHSMRMFTEVGRRVLPHCTGVGKALLAQLPEPVVQEIIARTGMPAYTPHTIIEPAALMEELARIRQRPRRAGAGDRRAVRRRSGDRHSHAGRHLGVRAARPPHPRGGRGCRAHHAADRGPARAASLGLRP
jgi:IclR family transcriptional regulator, acetate operon repressor